MYGVHYSASVPQAKQVNVCLAIQTYVWVLPEGEAWVNDKAFMLKCFSYE